jgi:hypothetical protein
MAVKVIPRSWREVARPFAIALGVLIVFELGVVVADALDMRTAWIGFTLVGFPVVGRVRSIGESY